MGACTSLEDARRQGSGFCNNRCFTMRLEDLDEAGKGLLAAEYCFCYSSLMEQGRMFDNC